MGDLPVLSPRPAGKQLGMAGGLCGRLLGASYVSKENIPVTSSRCTVGSGKTKR